MEAKLGSGAWTLPYSNASIHTVHYARQHEALATCWFNASEQHYYVFDIDVGCDAPSNTAHEFLATHCPSALISENRDFRNCSYHYFPWIDGDVVQ